VRAKRSVQLNVTQATAQLLALPGHKCFKGSFMEELLGEVMAFMALVLCKHRKLQLENNCTVQSTYRLDGEAVVLNCTWHCQIN